MRHIWFGVIAALVAVGSTANAADLGKPKAAAATTVTAPFGWGGFYIGLDAGYLGGTLVQTVPAAPSVSTASPSGLTLGAHAGYRHHYANNIVAGIELRAFGNINTLHHSKFSGFAEHGRAATDWGGDARVTAGYAVGRFMPYVAAGVAVANFRSCIVITPTSSCYPTTDYSGNRIGWTVGAGLAYALTDKLSARLDYSYSDFGTRIYNMGILLGGKIPHRLNSHAVRAGISYRF